MSDEKKSPEAEFYESLGHLIFWAIAFGIVLLGLAYLFPGECV